jgi:hypothetical protein
MENYRNYVLETREKLISLKKGVQQGLRMINDHNSVGMAIISVSGELSQFADMVKRFGQEFESAGIHDPMRDWMQGIILSQSYSFFY